MRTRMTWLARLAVLAVGVGAALSLSRGQDAAPAGRQSLPAGPTTTTTAPPVTAAPPAVPKPARDLSQLGDLQKQMLLAGRRGAEWLYKMNAPDGRFVYGYLPALKRPMDGDHYLRQAGAAFALARAARLTGDDRFTARATQAVLALLGDTAPDPRDPQARCTVLPPAQANRLAAAGLLVVAINELPAPEKDLLAKSEQLCNYIRKQQRPDGSLACDGDRADDPDGVNYYPGEALYGLMLSQRHQPAAWKDDVARKALAYYRAWWKQHRSVAFVPWQSAAFTEAYLRTRDAAFAEFVFEMNDWLCGLQYDRLDPRRPAAWFGGFMGWADGRPAETAPRISTASCAEGLAEACRAARQAGDVARHKRYTEALEKSLQFLVTLQYTEANTQHFADWYRPTLLGAFHASHQDGDLRIDYTQHAVCALAQYLALVVGIQ